MCLSITSTIILYEIFAARLKRVRFPRSLFTESTVKRFQHRKSSVSVTFRCPTLLSKQNDNEKSTFRKTEKYSVFSRIFYIMIHVNQKGRNQIFL